tara:strand:+ start:243 stop:1190 length:948 start_codon:yes stop_codon:yes gene_type:complete
MSILIVGGTGTLGRQIVKKALDEGYRVQCLVRDFRRASFLKEWGAELIYGDLSIPKTLPPTLKGVSIVIDCATVRSTNTYTSETVDWKGKVALIEASKLAGVKKFLFFSILNARKNSSIALLDLKLQIEKKLAASGLTYTVFECSGFFQGLINQYAISILDGQKIWVPGDSTPLAYLDTQDAARAVVNSLNNEVNNNKTVALLGKKFWDATEIIELCERLSGKTAKISYIPLPLFSFLHQFFRFFESTWNIADRLEFGLINSGKQVRTPPNNEIVWSTEPASLEGYLQEYFGKILRKLKETNYKQSQGPNEISFF